MSTTQVLGDASFSPPGQHPDSLTARIDALPSSPGLWSFITLLALGGFFELYDLFQTGYISTGLLAENIFHTGKDGVFGIADQAAFASSTFMGLFIGASLLAPLADRLGRRLTFMFALAWYGIFSLIMALQNSAEGVIFFRFLVGIGLGIELVTIDTYLSEWMPTHLRNKAFAYAFFIQFLSVPTVALMSWLLVPMTILGLSGWRWVIILGALCSLVIWVIRKKLPESARWLESKGRHDDAHRVMGEMEQRCGLSPSRRHASPPVSAPQRGNFKEIWAPQYRQRTLMLMVMNFFQAIGFFGFGNWLPALLSGQGASITHSLLYAFFITLAYPLGCLFCTRFVHRFENKWQIVLSALMTVIFGTLFALQNNPILLVICGFMITWSNAWLTISYHAYQAEVFPTHIRARAVGFCYSFSRLSTAVTSIMIGVILQYAGTPGVISFIVASMLMVMLSVGIFGPRTRGIRLENI
ncbi:MFS transporter [Klebsiella aerogenes]|nr:MFS transporter [Klebsiella aerogenes]EIW9476020.1 MFS transporter [Klebsiella aerogenes]EIW9496223.1 MFS transporter [Klebsiella aerogenes]EKM7510791.1 MFS transporter [Klebsiella aerogenes]EKV8806218.1 MFS transporter [Klebsiella aerogenes]EKZ9717014.1 MFS transporter [Klebsiella aerogenes]